MSRRVTSPEIRRSVRDIGLALSFAGLILALHAKSSTPDTPPTVKDYAFGNYDNGVIRTELFYDGKVSLGTAEHQAAQELLLDGPSEYGKQFIADSIDCRPYAASDAAGPLLPTYNSSTYFILRCTLGRSV